ncbi:MAG: DUF5615 family PIN-like protein [Bdellovibrionales bacterium]
MKIVADESLDFNIVQALRDEGFEVWAVIEQDPSIKDPQVLRTAFDQKALLLTEDKDFGELVVRLRLPHHGILLLRLGGFEPAFKIPLVLNALQKHFSEISSNFAVLNERKLRIRYLNR